MAFVLNDRVKETTTTTGTGTISLAGAETGFESFVAGIGTTNKTFYAIELPGQAEFEVGIGTVTDASPDTLSRDTIISSYPASKAPSASMTASTYAFNHSSTLSDDQTISNAVLAGPVTVTGTQTITGTVVVV